MRIVPEEGARGLLPLAALLVCTIFAPWWLFYLQSGHLSQDFSVFWAAANLPPDLIYNDAAVTAMQSDLVPHHGPRPWAYPPTTLLPILPFGFLPYAVAWPLFTVVTAAAFLAALWPVLVERRAIAYGLVILSQPFVFAAVNGQLIFIIGALVIGALVLLPNAPVRAGILFAIAAVIKPQLLVFAPVALTADRQFKALKSALAAAGGIALLTIPFGMERWHEWILAIDRFSETVEQSGILYRNVTPTGILWHLEASALVAANLCFAALGALLTWRVFRHSDDLIARLFALMGGAVFASPYMMNYDLTLLVPVAAALIVQNRLPLLHMLAAIVLLLANGHVVPPATVLFIVLTAIHYLKCEPRHGPQSTPVESRAADNQLARGDC